MHHALCILRTRSSALGIEKLRANPPTAILNPPARPSSHQPRTAADEIPAMDGSTDIPTTPSYSRDASSAGAAANPSAGLTGSAAASIPGIGLARGLFMAPRMNSVVAPPPGAKPRTSVSKRPVAAAATTAQKKGKADGTARHPKKHTAPTAPPPPEFGVPAAGAYMVFEEMHRRYEILFLFLLLFR